MAFWNRDKSGRLQVYYYDPEKGKQVKLSRNYLRHLDHIKEDAAIDIWVKRWAADNIKHQKTIPRVLLTTDEAYLFFEAFIEERKRFRNLSISTYKDAHTYFHKYVSEYFVTVHKEKDVRNWSLYMAGFPGWLLKKNLSNKYIKKIILTCRQFGHYLAANHIITHKWLVLIPVDNSSSATPLPRELKPKEVLKFAQSSSNSEVKLLALLGYFASLRPAETMALSVKDFYTGLQAIRVCKTQENFKKLKLGSKLTIHVNKQLRGTLIDKPKTRGSVGYVAVWYAPAAREIGELLKGKNGALFSKARETLFILWKEQGINGISLHDLRRSSGVYLGRTKQVPMLLLQEHMRHSSINTTMLYMRRPEQEKVDTGTQNFDDVG